MTKAIAQNISLIAVADQVEAIITTGGDRIFIKHVATAAMKDAQEVFDASGLTETMGVIAIRFTEEWARMNFAERICLAFTKAQHNPEQAVKDLRKAAADYLARKIIRESKAA
ncbi:hypothetical protein [Agrobacterium pusense]|uniref:hypothetical protein n=1 Tax=Agrobacterium pusense TaxID=648995 RepID=UPI000D36FADF|nr:hypothetical protein [Agrobacterium pusense]PTV70232.1 hypothetical protein DBL06_25550 [Agrobacterium pusense]